MNKKNIVMICVLSTGLLLLSACGGGGDISDISSSKAQSTAGTAVRTYDEAIGKPQIVPLTDSQLVAQNTPYVLSASVSSPDGGTISYQWYKNNVASNGGGTKIEGATQENYQVDSSVVGATYYYVVASNNHNDKYSMATSNVCQIRIIAQGNFTVDEFGGTRYLAADGSYPVNYFVNIEGGVYYFNEMGYMYTGWMSGDGYYIYFDGNGRMLIDGTTPEGYHTDHYGRLIEQVDPTAG